MDMKQYMDILHLTEKLKNNTRHSWTSEGRHESVAEHSFRLALMAYFMKDRFPEADMNRVVLMCLLHDMGEAFTGDIPAFEKTAADISTWLPLEYDLQLVYGDEQVQFSPVMKELKSRANEDTREKIDRQEFKRTNGETPEQRE